jgi:hypothetical protein
MLNEILSLWNWMFGMIAGWGATTTCMIVAIIILWLRVRALGKEISYLRTWRFASSKGSCDL